jgi:diguanylate cyclase (GGDEF)-like protein/PAS domain S-box-containing protein
MFVSSVQGGVMKNSEFFKSILNNISDGVYFVDKNRRIVFWNRGAERITGFTAEEVLGESCYSNILNHVDVFGNNLCQNGCPLYKTIIDGKERKVSVYLHHKQGHRVPVTVSSSPIMDGDEIIGAVELFVDDSGKHEILNNLEEYKLLSLTDPLTGLPNRRCIDVFLSSRYNEFKMADIPFGILFVDIDKFKDFNDTYGHDIGDEVLKMISKTCAGKLRTADMFGRYGGEEFVGIMSGASKRGIVDTADAIRLLTEQSILRLDGKELHVTISIGATLVKDNDSVQSVMQRADRMLYQSKENGRNRVTFG